MAGRRLLSARVREGQAWTRAGFRLDRPALEARSLKRLAQLIDGFRARGLCTESVFEAARRLTSIAELAALPVLTRRGAMDLYERLKERYALRHGVYARGTGGWTGEPVHVWRDRRVDDTGYGMLLEMQALMGWRPGMPCYCLWADPRELGIHEHTNRGPLGALRMVRLYGSLTPGPAHFEEFLSAVRADSGCCVYGSPGLLLQLCHHMRDHDIALPAGAVRAAWATAEAMNPRLPPLFRERFGAPLRDFYGSRETPSVSAECEHGQRHVNSRYVVEICDPDTHEVLPEGRRGQILLTDLFNDVTPLIRYEIGDLGAIEWRDCECGRQSFVFSGLIGRPPEVITLASGKQLTPYCFLSLAQSFPAIRQVQVVRHGIDDFEYRYVGGELGAADELQLGQLISRITGGAQVWLRRVDALEKSPSGKQRYFIDESGAGELPLAAEPVGADATI